MNRRVIAAKSITHNMLTLKVEREWWYFNIHGRLEHDLWNPIRVTRQSLLSVHWLMYFCPPHSYFMLGWHKGICVQEGGWCVSDMEKLNKVGLSRNWWWEALSDGHECVTLLFLSRETELGLFSLGKLWKAGACCDRWWEVWLPHIKVRDASHAQCHD